MVKRKALTLVELVIVVLIIGTLAMVAVPRLSSSATNAKIKTCDTNVDLINTRIELFVASDDIWPTALSDIIQNTDCFPDGVPVCPFGAAYVMDGPTHRVVNHDHSDEIGATASAKANGNGKSNGNGNGHGD
jgi:prepilin-type N-terminal cleavage/methylation domain-containing protein